MMIKLFLKISALAGLFVSLAAPFAQVHAAGLDGLHSQVRIGKRICFVDHDHSSGGSGVSRKTAMRAAISGWASFTALEYGNEWGRFSLAKNRSARCYRSGLGRTGKWSCDVVAVACRRLKRSDIRAARGYGRKKLAARSSRHRARQRRRSVRR